jgi:TIR domain-containing protein
MAAGGAMGWLRSLFGLESPYDVFISYRRKHSAELAQLLRRALEDRGLHVFLDVRELGAGPFDEQLLRRIGRTTDFVVILTPNCLDDARRPGDWLAAEVGHAFDTGRNVVPVAAGGFQCPPADQLPPMLVELPRQQWVRYDHEFSDESIERLFRMLRSRRHGAGGLVGVKRFPRLRWVVLGALGLLFGLIALAAMIENSSSVSPTPFFPTGSAPAGGGPQLWCCDLGGFKRCMLAVPAPLGSQCFCPGQGTGITCM